MNENNENQNLVNNVQSATPVQPEVAQPVQPATPVQPEVAQPVQPATPVQPEVVQPVQPTTSDQPIAFAGFGGATIQSESSAPVQPQVSQVHPATPMQPEVAQPVQPSTPVQPETPKVEPENPQISKTIPTKESVEEKPKKKKNVGMIVFFVLMAIIIGIFVYFTVFHPLNPEKKEEKEEQKEIVNPVLEFPYHMTDNSLQKFDLEFLKLESGKKNKVYSPLAIKYALEMLAEGADGETKAQLDAVIGEYVAKKYTNSSNMSFANALFVRDTYKDSIQPTYVDLLQNKYNAEVVYDSFETATPLNDWVSEKTLRLINHLVDDLSTEDYALVNALAIDMEWNKLIQAKDLNDAYSVEYLHEKYSSAVSCLSGTKFKEIAFENLDKKVTAAEIGASINRYDIVNDLGEDKIREEVGAAYQEYLNKGQTCGNEELNVDTYLDQYIEEINSNYGKVDSSTDFSFLDDENVKAFAKNLKTYDGVTLQYIGIMPKTGELEDYIQNTDQEKINTIIQNLKTIELNNFEEGVITKITGFIPLFEMEYDLDLKNDLIKMGITDVFDASKANLSKLSTKEGTIINNVSHKTNISFTNEGIKAAAAVQMGGYGDGRCGFNYDFEVPVKEIDLTFDRPYLFFVRDVNSGEVWFTGTVYEPGLEIQYSGSGAH